RQQRSAGAGGMTTPWSLSVVTIAGLRREAEAANGEYESQLGRRDEDLLAGRSVLPLAQDTDIYLAGLGILLAAVYITGLIFRPRRQVLGIGLDSLAVLVLYGIGTAGLVLIAGAT